MTRRATAKDGGQAAARDISNLHQTFDTVGIVGHGATGNIIIQHFHLHVGGKYVEVMSPLDVDD